MNADFFEALELLEKEKGIPKSHMLERVEAAITAAVKRDYGVTEGIKVVADEQKKDIRVYISKHVVESVSNPNSEISVEEAKRINKRLEPGDSVDIEIKPRDFGRISAQTAKQVIIQGIREAERGLILQEFSSKEHEILSALVVKVDPKNKTVTLEIGKAEAIMTANEQLPGETIREGDRIKVYVVEVKKTTKGPQVVISRTHPNLVKRLFELEVPEIYDGTVEIKAISREPGSRTKMAVWSKDPNVDPVGACIGPKGSRVSNVVNELKGEKIDIIRYSEDPAQFVAAALSPSEVIRVELLPGEKACRAIVPNDQLSLAIGKEGQNARLAARLTGWKIDIKPQSLEA